MDTRSGTAPNRVDAPGTEPVAELAERAGALAGGSGTRGSESGKRGGGTTRDPSVAPGVASRSPKVTRRLAGLIRARAGREPATRLQTRTAARLILGNDGRSRPR